MKDRILRKPDINDVTGFSDVTIRSLEAQGLFPRRFKLNPLGKHVGWRESEVMAWIEERAASRDAA
jgi:predicted DNA-binding transcriptional regulator AlpA